MVRLLAFALEQVAGRVPVLAGTGEAGTAKTVAATRRAQVLGADAALVVTPYYVRPTQEGLFRHFTDVADKGGLPVMKDGQCLGAVGVSGVKSSEDAQIARAGIAAIGL